MITVRAFAGFLLILLLATVGLTLELTGQGFVYLGVGCGIAGKKLSAACFCVGLGMMQRADQVVGVSLLEDWDD